MARNRHTKRSDRGVRKSSRQRALASFLQDVRDMKREFDQDKQR